MAALYFFVLLLSIAYQCVITYPTYDSELEDILSQLKAIKNKVPKLLILYVLIIIINIMPFPIRLIRK